MTRRVDAHFGDYADARAQFDDALGLLANCADIYTRCDDTNRRVCNQAFFTKVYIDEDNELRVEHNRPFEMLLDPQVNANANALTWAADAHKARTSTNASVGKGSSLVRAVELRGLEPLTPTLPVQSRSVGPVSACPTICALSSSEAGSAYRPVGARMCPSWDTLGTLRGFSRTPARRTQAVTSCRSSEALTDDARHVAPPCAVSTSRRPPVSRAYARGVSTCPCVPNRRTLGRLMD